MKVKQISELTLEERADFERSEVFRHAHADYRQCDVHMNYYKEYFGEVWKDLSLVAFEKQDFYVCIYMLTNGKEISFFGSPLEICADTTLPVQNQNKAFSEVFARLEQIKKEYRGG